MNMFDARMIVTFQALQMEYELFVRYVDDLRKFMRSIRRGCFWDENKRRVMWSKTKEEEDSLTTGLERTSELLGDMMNSMVEGMKFTTETCLDFDGQFLPTLDINIRVVENPGTQCHVLDYRFYQKPMATGLVTQMKSAQCVN